MARQMQQVRYLVPERCGKCGGYFDLKFDLFEIKESGLEELAVLQKEARMHLCWSCRGL